MTDPFPGGDDPDLIAASDLAGVPDEFQRVTAIHSGIQPTGITTASVSLAGEAVPDAMWIYRRGAVVRSELTVTTDRGSAVVTWEGDQVPQLQINCRRVECHGSAQRLAPIAEALVSHYHQQQLQA